MPVSNYFIVFQCMVTGENDAFLGSDETNICRIDYLIIDASLNKVTEGENIVIAELQCVESIEDLTGEQESAPDDVDGLSLINAVKQIETKIEALSSDGSTVCFISDGILHFRQCLHPHCVRLGIKLEKVFFEFYDVRKEYRKWSGKDEFATLKEIAADAGIEDEANTTEDRNKCHLCAEVLRELIRNGHSFETPEKIMDHLLPGMSTGYVKDETVVRVRGLPWQVSDHDVAAFFKGLDIARGGVALCLNTKGRRNGEALLRFENEENRGLAIKRHKHHLSGRYIEVYKGTAQDFLKIARGPSGAMNATASFLSNGGEVIIRMRGLPYTADVKDVIEFFGSDPTIHHGESGVLLVYHPDGTSTGDAFVIFGGEEEGKAALKKHREKIGSRYVELFRSTQAELQQVLTMYNVGYQFVSPVGLVSPLMPPLSPLPGAFPAGLVERGGPSPRAQSLMTMSCLRLRGLPFSASKDDIVTFLGQNSQGIVGTVHIIYNLQGRPSGESFVQLKTPELAHKAANELHLKHMGERYIEVFQCSVHDMSLMLATSHANQMAAQHMNHANNNNNNNTNNNYIQHSSLPIQPGHRLLSPTGSNGLVHPIISPLPTIYNGHYPHLSPTVSPGGFFPAHPAFPLVGTMVPPEGLNYPINHYGKPNGMTLGFTYPAPEDAHRAYTEKNKHTTGNRCVELFMA